MTKLIEVYRADRSLKNAQKLRRAYERKHQMAVWLLTKEDADLLADAIQHAFWKGERKAAKHEAKAQSKDMQS